MNPIDLSTTMLDLVLEVAQDRLQLQGYSLIGLKGLEALPISDLFAVYVDGKRYDASNLIFQKVEIEQKDAGLKLEMADPEPPLQPSPASDGGSHTKPVLNRLQNVYFDHAILFFSGTGFEVEHHIQVYGDTALIEVWQVVRATGDEALHITRMDSFSLDIAAADYEVMAFNSDWGQEFEPVRTALKDNLILETRKGRSSKGQHPYFALFHESGQVLSGAVAWSGNWVCRFEKLAEDGYRLSGGLHDWSFSKNLAVGEVTESAHCVLALGRDLNHVSQQYAQVGRQVWYPHNTLSTTLPVEWNHWWSYEDVDINEAVFLENVNVAAQLGVEICTLDAGWFGPSGGTEWHSYRGDWDLVNTKRFPNGIRAIADAVHAQGMKFGLWCEIEGLGKLAALATHHPEFSALRDGVPLGYVCLGNVEAQEWAYQTLSRLIQEYDCDWVKLDFNLDPEAGCNRVDHGHGAGDGLYEHVQGYYRVLDRIRERFPEVVLENCASGGLRIDLGVLKHTHMTFLSDPDWPVHDLQIFWGATTMLAADACLHWSFSEWRMPNPPPQQTFKPHDPNLTAQQLDFYTRIGMLGVFGLCQKLPQLPEWVNKRLAQHIQIYKDHVRRFVREADLYRLTEQPRRIGDGDRWCAFQYSLPDWSEHLLFVFRMTNSESERRIKLTNLEPEGFYQISGFEGEVWEPMSGRDLMDVGIRFEGLGEEESALVRVF